MTAEVHHPSYPIGEFDAYKWAEFFVQQVQEKPSIATDVETMHAWFSGAIMTGYDHARIKYDC